MVVGTAKRGDGSEVSGWTVHYLDLDAKDEDTVYIAGNRAAHRTFDSLDAARGFMAEVVRSGGLVFSYRQEEMRTK